MGTENRERLDAMIARVVDDITTHQLRGWGGYDLNDFVGHIVYLATEFWAECPDDFCLQHVDSYSLSIIFGSCNRVRWGPKFGFRLIESDCNPDFISHFNQLRR